MRGCGRRGSKRAPLQRAPDQVLLTGNTGVGVEHKVGERTVPGGAVRGLKVQAIPDVEKHEQAFEIVVAVGAPPGRAKQVQLGRGKNGNRFSSVGSGGRAPDRGSFPRPA